MATSPYNNPMFASSIGSLIETLIPKPGERAQAELTASKALMNNATALYRDQMGLEGLQGDLSAMMIRALQAGPEYADRAPGIGNQAIKFGAIGYGHGPYSADRAGPALSALMGLGEMGRIGGGGGGGGGRGGSSGRGGGDPNDPSQDAYDWGKLTATDRSKITSMLRRGIEDGTFPADMTEMDLLGILSRNQQGYSDPYNAISDMGNESNWTFNEEEVVTNPPGTAASRFLHGLTGGRWGVDPSGPPDATTMQPVGPPVFAPSSHLGAGVPTGGLPDIARPTSEAELAALPPGTKWMAPDGSIRVK